VLVKPGKIVKVVAKGRELGHSLGSSPEPVDAVLTLGEHRYCMTFGGRVAFKAGKKYLARKTPPASACP